MKHWLKLNEIIYKRLIKGPASVEIENIWMSRFSSIKMFFVSNIIPIHTRITTKLKWKLFTNVIKEPSEEAWGLDRQRKWLKEKHDRQRV